MKIEDSLGLSHQIFKRLAKSPHIVTFSPDLKIFNFPITIATFQCLTAAIFSFFPALALEYVSFKVLSLEAAELIYAGVLSSGVAFMFQIIALQNISPAPAVIINFGEACSKIS